MSEIKLKACPFCGSPDDCLIVEHMKGTVMRPAYRVYCDYCAASTGYTDRGNHVELWNSRSPQWQKIESAEKDGKTQILLWELGEVFIGVRPIGCPDDAAADLMGVACYPSHWMPITPPREED